MKPLQWVGSSKKDYLTFDLELRDEFGYALYVAQRGDMPDLAKPLKGFGGASVLELRSQYEGSAFRVVYVVKFEEAVYVLHAFQKKSKSGIATPKMEVELIKNRLRMAEAEHERWKNQLK